MMARGFCKLPAGYSRQAVFAKTSPLCGVDTAAGSAYEKIAEGHGNRLAAAKTIWMKESGCSVRPLEYDVLSRLP